MRTEGWGSKRPSDWLLRLHERLMGLVERLLRHIIATATSAVRHQESPPMICG